MHYTHNSFVKRIKGLQVQAKDCKFELRILPFTQRTVRQCLAKLITNPWSTRDTSQLDKSTNTSILKWIIDETGEHFMQVTLLPRDLMCHSRICRQNERRSSFFTTFTRQVTLNEHVALDDDNTGLCHRHSQGIMIVSWGNYYISREEKRLVDCSPFSPMMSFLPMMSFSRNDESRVTLSHSIDSPTQQQHWKRASFIDSLQINHWCHQSHHIEILSCFPTLLLWSLSCRSFDSLLTSYYSVTLFSRTESSVQRRGIDDQNEDDKDIEQRTSTSQVFFLFLIDSKV